MAAGHSAAAGVAIVARTLVRMRGCEALAFSQAAAAGAAGLTAGAPWQLGADSARCLPPPHTHRAAANSTFWNTPATLRMVSTSLSKGTKTQRLRNSTGGYTSAPIQLPPCDFGPLLNFVGNYYLPDPKASVASINIAGRRLLAAAPTPKLAKPGINADVCALVRWWVESLGVDVMQPQDLYSAQFMRRTGRAPL